MHNSGLNRLPNSFYKRGYKPKEEGGGGKAICGLFLNIS